MVILQKIIEGYAAYMVDPGQSDHYLHYLCRPFNLSLAGPELLTYIAFCAWLFLEGKMETGV